jgi:hypothetical protein
MDEVFPLPPQHEGVDRLLQKLLDAEHQLWSDGTHTAVCIGWGSSGSTLPPGSAVCEGCRLFH